MDPLVIDALKVLGFEELDVLPKVRDIIRKYRKLAFLNHPDRNNGCPEAKARFQDILNAYNVAGDAAEAVPVDPGDKDDHIARKLFKQFQVKSVKQNSSSVTIHTEKSLYLIWMEVLTDFAGVPENKGPNGNKFTFIHTLDDSSFKVYLTMYHTGKLLIQAEKNKQCINLHFLNNYLENLFTQVYKKHSNMKSLTTNDNKSRTPITKPVKTISRISVMINNCDECNFQTTDPAKLRRHKKKEHIPIKPGRSSKRFDIPAPLNVLPLTPIEQSPGEAFPMCDQSSPINLHQAPPSFSCDLCSRVFQSDDRLKNHIKLVHEVQCLICHTIFYDSYDLSVHKLAAHTNHAPMNVPCFLCGKCFDDPATATKHLQYNHEILCSRCDNIFYDRQDLNLHMLSVHNFDDADFIQLDKRIYNDILEVFASLPDNLSLSQACHCSDQYCNSKCSCECTRCSFDVTPLPLSDCHDDHSNFKCDSCEFSTKNSTNLVDHIASHHPPTSLPCDSFLVSLCEDTESPEKEDILVNITNEQSENEDFLVNTTNNHAIHIEPNNSTIQTLKMIQDRQLDMLENLKKLTDTLSTKLDDISTLHQSLRSDVQIQAYNSTLLRTSVSNLEAQHEKMSKQIDSLSNKTINITQASKPANMSTATLSHPSGSPPFPTNIPSMPPAQEMPSLPPPSHDIGRLITSDREKILFLSDSVGNFANKRQLEEATNTLIFNENMTEAHLHSDPWSPHQNLHQAVARAATKRDYKHAVLQGASSDISIIDTTNPTPTNVAAWHQEVFGKAKNTITAAENILKSNPSIDKVLILDQIPRFDPAFRDPSSYKPRLAQYFNDVLRQELTRSSLKDRIFCHTLSLPTTCHEHLYGSPYSTGYDGVHLQGPEGMKFFTMCLCNIFQRVFNKNARSPHNHKLLTPNQKVNRLPHSLVTAPPSCPKYPGKPDSVVIDIEFVQPLPEAPFAPPISDSIPTYSVPTFNFFDTLGN